MDGPQVLASDEKSIFLLISLFIKHSLMLIKVVELGKKIQEKSQRSIDQTDRRVR